MPITRQQLSKCIPTATDTHTAIQELLEMVFYMRLMLKLHDATRDYWVFGLCSSSGILKKTKEHVLETASVSVLG
jgi:hypothetical protein